MTRILASYSILVTIILVGISTKSPDKTILDIAENSYFVGCKSNSTKLDCRESAIEYRKELSDATRILDLD